MVDKLIVVDIAPKAYAPGHDDIFNGLYAINVKVLRTRQEADAALAGKVPEVAVRQFLLKNLERNTAGTFKWRINLDAIHTNYEEILKGLETNRTFEKPTLVIKGGCSGYIQEGDTATLREIFPQAQIIAIPGAGHWVHAEAPQEFARIVRNFLA
jgi:esterase